MGCPHYLIPAQQEFETEKQKAERTRASLGEALGFASPRKEDKEKGKGRQKDTLVDGSVSAEIREAKARGRSTARCLSLWLNSFCTEATLKAENERLQMAYEKEKARADALQTQSSQFFERLALLVHSSLALYLSCGMMLTYLAH